MTSAADDRVRRRRVDVKTSDTRDKSLSPLDKDELKLRCLQRVRNERHRLISRMRDRQHHDSPGTPRSGKAGLGLTPSHLATVLETPTRQEAGSIADSCESSNGHGQPELMLSSARQILRYGLNDIQQAAASGKKRARRSEQIDPKNGGQPQQQPQQQLWHVSTTPTTEIRKLFRNESSGPSPSPHLPPRLPSAAAESNLMELAEEQAYRTACGDGGGGGGASSSEAIPEQYTPNSRPPSTGWTSAALNSDAGVPGCARVAGDGEGGGDGAVEMGGSEGPSSFDEEELLEDEQRLLSPEEYVEMMRYIEEACREEDARAEAEVLREYERNRRLEQDVVEFAVASNNVDGDGPDQNDGVLCPVCKRDYLLEPGPPSAAIVCACGFRLDTRGDRLGLEYVKQQLAETYAEHSAGCSAEPTFSVEGTGGLEILWSACDGCGFARVVI